MRGRLSRLTTFRIRSNLPRSDAGARVCDVDIELDAGRIRMLDAQSDKGSTFRVVIPLSAPVTDDADATLTPLPRTGSGERPPLRLQGIRVLVVEDEEDAREFVGALLASRGASVRLTASAAEAYVSLNEGIPDVILSDIG